MKVRGCVRPVRFVYMLMSDVTFMNISAVTRLQEIFSPLFVSLLCLFEFVIVVCDAVRTSQLTVNMSSSLHTELTQ